MVLSATIPCSRSTHASKPPLRPLAEAYASLDPCEMVPGTRPGAQSCVRSGPRAPHSQRPCPRRRLMMRRGSRAQPTPATSLHDYTACSGPFTTVPIHTPLFFFRKPLKNHGFNGHGQPGAGRRPLPGSPADPAPRKKSTPLRVHVLNHDERTTGHQEEGR